MKFSILTQAIVLPMEICLSISPSRTCTSDITWTRPKVQMRTCRLIGLGVNAELVTEELLEQAVEHRRWVL